jgi:hypothetical protein
MHAIPGCEAQARGHGVPVQTQAAQIMPWAWGFGGHGFVRRRLQSRLRWGGGGGPCLAAPGDQAGVDLARDHIGITQSLHQKGRIGLHWPAFDLRRHGAQSGDGLCAVGGMVDQLGQHGVVMRADRIALRKAGVHAAMGQAEVVQNANAGQKPVRGIFGIEAGLYRMAVQDNLILRQGQGLAISHADLPCDQIDVGDRLGHGVFDLQPRVHFHEPDAVGAQALAGVGNEFHRARADIVHSSRRPHRRRAQGIARGGVHAGGGGFLDHLLVAALQAAIAFEEVDDVAMGVAKDLHLDMARMGDIAFEQDMGLAKRLLRLALA